MKALIAIRDPKSHAQRRRPWARALNTNSMKDYEIVVARRVAQLVNALEESASPVDLARWISYFS